MLKVAQKNNSGATAGLLLLLAETIAVLDQVPDIW